MKPIASLAAAMALGIPASSHASMMFSIEAASRAGTASFTVDETMLQPGATRADGSVEWSLAQPLVLPGRYAQPVATLESLRFVIGATGQTIALDFDVVSGPAMTMFTFTSAEFPLSLPSFYASASAGISLTDLDGDGAELFGEFPGGAYQARYNAATVFATLLPSPMGVGTFASDTDSGSTGPLTHVPAPVSSVQSEFSFSLSPNDRAAGTSVFIAEIPSPATGAAIALAGMAALRRRRA